MPSPFCLLNLPPLYMALASDTWRCFPNAHATALLTSLHRALADPELLQSLRDMDNDRLPGAARGEGFAEEGDGDGDEGEEDEKDQDEGSPGEGDECDGKGQSERWILNSSNSLVSLQRRTFGCLVVDGY